MNEKPVVLLDACVLYPYILRDFLIHLSFTAKLYYPKWTQRIQEEWARNLIKNTGSIDTKKVARIQKLMNAAIPDALMEERTFEKVIPTLSLPDKDDVHVLAAAIAGDAEAIITFNLKDFPTSVLANYGMKAIHPDEFVLFLCSIGVDRVLDALITQAAIMQNPPKSARDVVNFLEKMRLTKSAVLLKRFL